MPGDCVEGYVVDDKESWCVSLLPSGWGQGLAVKGEVTFTKCLRAWERSDCSLGGRDLLLPGNGLQTIHLGGTTSIDRLAG